jgi:hypothetical protein
MAEAIISRCMNCGRKISLDAIARIWSHVDTQREECADSPYAQPIKFPSPNVKGAAA